MGLDDTDGDHIHKHDDSNWLKTILSLGHTHGDDQMTLEETTEEGIRVVKISFAGLMITALFQIIVVFFTDSVALIADTVHNFSDAFTSIPLWIAFRLSQRKKSRQYSYGYGRAEDLAGLFIVIMIGASAILIFYESINRLINPTPIRNLLALAIASVIGFGGNEIVAQYRITMGKRIGSEALVADGMHARTDGLTSLAILIGVIGSYLGYPQTDAIIGILIGFLILVILRDASKSVFVRLMDGVEPELIEKIEHLVCQNDQVVNVHGTRARWSGRAMYAELHVELNHSTTIGDSHKIAEQIQNKLKEEIPNLASVNIHFDPI